MKNMFNIFDKFRGGGGDEKPKEMCNDCGKPMSECTCEKGEEK